MSHDTPTVRLVIAHQESPAAEAAAGISAASTAGDESSAGEPDLALVTAERQQLEERVYALEQQLAEARMRAETGNSEAERLHRQLECSEKQCSEAVSAAEGKAATLKSQLEELQNAQADTTAAATLQSQQIQQHRADWKLESEEKLRAATDNVADLQRKLANLDASAAERRRIDEWLEEVEIKLVDSEQEAEQLREQLQNTEHLQQGRGTTNDAGNNEQKLAQLTQAANDARVVADAAAAEAAETEQQLRHQLDEAVESRDAAKADLERSTVDVPQQMAQLQEQLQVAQVPRLCFSTVIPSYRQTVTPFPSSSCSSLGREI